MVFTPSLPFRGHFRANREVMDLDSERIFPQKARDMAADFMISNRNVWTNRNARKCKKTKDGGHFYSRQI
jgi:hypothetical protein